MLLRITEYDDKTAAFFPKNVEISYAQQTDINIIFWLESSKTGYKNAKNGAKPTKSLQKREKLHQP